MEVSFDVYLVGHACCPDLRTVAACIVQMKGKRKQLCPALVGGGRREEVAACFALPLSLRILLRLTQVWWFCLFGFIYRHWGFVLQINLSKKVILTGVLGDGELRVVRCQVSRPPLLRSTAEYSVCSCVYYCSRCWLRFCDC